MALTVTGQLTMPDGSPLAGAEVHLTAKRNEATSIVTGVSSFFTTGSNGQYSQQIESGYYAVSISYSSVPGADPRRWSLGDIWVEDGDPISINALLSLDQSAADPANAALQQMLADAQQARDEAVQAAQDAQEAVDGVPEVGTGPGQVPTNSDLGSAAYTESSAYATAAQGALAENAQPSEAGKGLSTNDFTDPLKSKLESLEGTHWRGQFTSLSALESGVVDPKPGDYADVDVAGAEARRYIWDETDQEWVAQSGVVPPLTASQVKQLYESNPDTNAFDDEDKNKLDSIDPSSYAVSGTGDSQVRTNSQLDARYAQRSVTVTPLPATSESFYGLQAEDGQRFSTAELFEGAGYGGADVYFDASLNKSNHDGRRFFSPTVPPASAQSGASIADRIEAWRSGTGEEDENGSGCFVVIASDQYVGYTPISQSSFKADKDVTLPRPDSSVKMIERSGATDALVYTAKHSSGEIGYVAFYLRQNQVTTTNSAGAPAELLRVTRIFEFIEVITWLNTITSSNNTDIDHLDTDTLRYFTPLDNVSDQSRGTPIKAHRINAGGDITYTIPGAAGNRQRRGNIAFVTSRTSSSNGVNIIIGGTVVASDIDLSQDNADGRARVIEFEIPYNLRFDDDITITVENTGAGIAYVVGANLWHLGEMPSSNIYTDAFRAYSTEQQYRNSDGASDYAIYDSDDNQWVGSFHGGETQEFVRYELDGADEFDYAGKSHGEIETFQSLRIYQRTDIAGKLKAHSFHEFVERGSYFFRVAMEGDINCSQFRTCMATTSPTFNVIESPRWVSGIEITDPDITLEDGHNHVIQYQEGAGNLRCSVEYTHFESLLSKGAYARPNSSYVKFYYGPVEDRPEGVKIKNISFAARHSFY